MKTKLIVFLIVFLSVLFVSLAFSQTEEITLTTYYPSPFGSYGQLAANRFAVGGGTMPAAQGVVNFRPTSQPLSGNAGDIYFDSAGVFRFHNGIDWARLGGGTLRVISAKRRAGSGSPAIGPITYLSPGSSLSDFVEFGTPSSGSLQPPFDNFNVGGAWGIGCNASRGWQAVGCNMSNSSESPADHDEDYVIDANGNSGCATDNEEWDATSMVYVVCAKVE